MLDEARDAITNNVAENPQEETEVNASEGGKVLLKAEKATLEVSGEIYANGGKVHILGEEVVIKEPAIIDVSAKGQ